jgi:hypothetical protein
MTRRVASLFAIVALGGCPSIYPRYEPVEPPSTPAPIDGLNTEWDDYNAAKPPGLDQLIFSTSRGSRGKHLDIWRASIQLGTKPHVIGEAHPYAPELMSPADERGPLQVSIRTFEEATTGSVALSFTSAREGGAGGLDLYWGQEHPPLVHRLEHLSSAANDAYLTDRFGEVMRPRVLFASDRDGGSYDLYEAQWDSYLIGGPPLSLKKLDALSSNADDSAPYVATEYAKADIVFASKREGGRGGWDIWCSHFDGTTYSPPVPVQLANSEHDEFRPSVAERRFLVFSSNRPGGRGGFDLYAVRFDGCGATVHAAGT